jgi:predicted PurR-regulated permease PerM
MPTPLWASLFKTQAPLLYVATFALLVTILSHGQAVIVPLAMAVMLMFILTPVVTALERRRLPRMVAVALAVVCTRGVVGGLGYVFSRQFRDFATQIPRYSDTIKQKLTTLRASRKGVITDIQKTIAEVGRAGLATGSRLDVLGVLVVGTARLP